MKMTYSNLMKNAMLAAVLLPALACAEDNTDRRENVLNAAVNSESRLVNVLQSGTSVDVADDDGETALMKAAADGNVRAIQLLVKHGSMVDRRDEDGRTALMYAAKEGNTEAVKDLLSAGANPTLRDEDGKTALNLAEDDKHADTADVLRAAMTK